MRIMNENKWLDNLCISISEIVRGSHLEVDTNQSGPFTAAFKDTTVEEVAKAFERLGWKVNMSTDKSYASLTKELEMDDNMWETKLDVFPHHIFNCINVSIGTGRQNTVFVYDNTNSRNTDYIVNMVVSYDGPSDNIAIGLKKGEIPGVIKSVDVNVK